MFWYLFFHHETSTVGIHRHKLSPGWPQLLLYAKEETTDLLQPCSSQHGVSVWYSNDRSCAEYHFKGNPRVCFDSGGVEQKIPTEKQDWLSPFFFFFFLMESHDERGTTRGKGESAEDNNMYSVFYVCQWKRYTECEFKLACVSL